ncbi:iron chelate uptake ABC transporter family permease subunit, partial [Rhizobium ruizarguesonis]
DLQALQHAEELMRVGELAPFVAQFVTAYVGGLIGGVRAFSLDKFLQLFFQLQLGGIGFVGIVVPHILRMAIGPDHRFLMPAAALLGG